MKILLCLLFFVTVNLSSAEKYILSIAAIFQNEAPYMNEWIAYHHKKGVEHFWLYNNNSTDNFREVLDPWISQGIVDLIEWPSVQLENDWHHFSFTVQTDAYDDGIRRAKHVSKWLALIDIDEFIVPVVDSSISNLLETRFKGVSGLCVNWQCFGTSGVNKAIVGHLLQSLTHKMRWNHDWNKNSKSIVNPLHVIRCPHPHFCLYNNNHWAINSNGVRTEMCCADVSIDVIRINHYWTKDEDFFWNTKVARYKKWGNELGPIISHAEAMNDEEDRILADL